ncbi:MAG: asparagine synthase (glutamine-hydrolyzing) [Pirellulaceae bacterium]|nr:asparagine synthase (glutamine-hydrolyzing) [Pirellulaceae bacterium]
MCGITGAFWLDDAFALSRSTLEQMTDSISHRGPDERGLYFEPSIANRSGEKMGIGLGHRRLSIIDVACGHQPMKSIDGNTVIVFNGEIYNHNVLRRDLEKEGLAFRTKSDTEVILALYQKFGIDCFDHLIGMFAVAIWDKKEQRLVLARDRAGQKPLYYQHKEGRLAFGSELKTLLQIPTISKEILPEAVDSFLTYGYVPHPLSIYREVKKLCPGERVVFSKNQFAKDKYWDIHKSKNSNLSGDTAADSPAQRLPTSEDEYIEQLQKLLTDAVTIRMESEVPLGAFLSGGLDSSIVVALMQQQSSSPVQTFSIGFPVKEYDETHYAKMVASHLGTDHHELEVKPDILAIMEKLLWHYDEPMGDSSAIPMWYLSEFTRRYVTVALSGDGSDELFGGYSRYAGILLLERLRFLGPVKNFLGLKLWQKLPGGFRQKSRVRKFKRFSEIAGKSPLQQLQHIMSLFTEERRKNLYQADFRKKIEKSRARTAMFLEEPFAKLAEKDRLTQLSLTDFLTYLPGDLLCKVDIATMAHSLECRSPMLDHRVVELAAKMPEKYKYQNGKGKQILWKAFGHLLPKEIGSRKKMGFAVPLDYWFRNELRGELYETLFNPQARCLEYFCPKAMKKLFSEHMENRVDHCQRLWSLMLFEKWLQKWS